MNAAATPQPAPLAGREDVTELVLADLRARREMGTAKYGTPLMTFNGRDALMDSYQEALDLVMYLRQALAERDAYIAAAIDRAAVERDLEAFDLCESPRPRTVTEEIAEIRAQTAAMVESLTAIDERLAGAAGRL